MGIFSLSIQAKAIRTLQTLTSPLFVTLGKRTTRRPSFLSSRSHEVARNLRAPCVFARAKGPKHSPGAGVASPGEKAGLAIACWGVTTGLFYHRNPLPFSVTATFPFVTARSKATSRPQKARLLRRRNYELAMTCWGPLRGFLSLSLRGAGRRSRSRRTYFPPLRGTE